MLAIIPAWPNPIFLFAPGRGGRASSPWLAIAAGLLVLAVAARAQSASAVFAGPQNMDQGLQNGLNNITGYVFSILKCLSLKTLYAELRKHLGEVFRRLAEQKESRIEEGHLLPDHVHMLIAIPPKYAVAQVIGFIKGKSAIHLARVYGEQKRNFTGQHFWARGYYVSTVGRDEHAIRDYILNQEEEDKRLDQMNLWR